MGNHPNYPAIELLKNSCQQSNKKINIENQRRNDSSRLVSISDNYQKRLPFFYNELLEAGLHCVMEWKLKHTHIWLKVIGLSQLYPKFCQLGIDGSVLLLLDQNDLKQEIGVRSVMTLGILMAWVTKGFIEFENYLQQKGILRERRKKNCEYVQKLKQMMNNVDFGHGEQNGNSKNEKLSEANINNIEKRMQRSYAQSTYRNRKMPNESRISKTEVIKLQNNTNIATNWADLENSQDMPTNRLQIMDKLTNICVQVIEVPFNMVLQMDIIYKQYGLPKNNNRKPPTKIPQNQQQLFILDLIQNSQRRKPLCIRQLLFVPKVGSSIRQPHKSKQIIDHLFKSSVEVVITKTTNSNNMDEFRLSLMADDLLHILQNLQEFYQLQRSRQSQISKSKAIFERSIKNSYEDSMKFQNEPYKEDQQETELQNDALNMSLSCAETQLNCQQVSCYLLLQQPMKIPKLYSNNMKTKKQYQMYENKVHNYKDVSSMNEFERRSQGNEKNSLSLLYEQQQKLLHLPALNTWRFQVNGFIFEPEFVASNINNITNMVIRIRDKNVKFELSPLPKDHRIDESQFIQSMQNQLFSSNSFQLFFICSNSNNQKIQILTPHLYEPLSLWLSEPPQIKLQKLAVIIYCLQRDQFYISNFKDIDLFIKNKWRQSKLNNLKDGTNKKRLRSNNCIQETIFKSRGARIQKMVQKNEMNEAIEIGEYGKYKSNRVQYQRSGLSKRQSQQQKDIWIKMPICKKTNKMNNLNSIKINKGMSIKLAGRQYTFNICGSIVHQEPLEKATTNPFQSEETNYVKRSSSQYSELSNEGVRRAQLSKLNRCIICYDNESNCLFYDCMHNVTCLSCGKLLETCPMCRKRVVDHMRVYVN